MVVVVLVVVVLAYEDTGEESVATCVGLYSVSSKQKEQNVSVLGHQPCTKLLLGPWMPVLGNPRLKIQVIDLGERFSEN